MATAQPYRIKTISQYHQIMGLPRPEHPLISVVNLESLTHLPFDGEVSLIVDYYSISIKKITNARYKYGQQRYDFDEGVMFFMAPGQLFSLEIDKEAPTRPSGWMLLIHPDFLWNTPLAKTIRQYDYFDYSVHEALYLSEKEETTIVSILQNIEHEYNANIDKFSQDVIVAQLELLLKYADRFYHRQFLTRKITNHKILDRLETIIADYFDSDELMKNGLPTVQYVAETLNISPTYLSALLKVITGQTTQQHIHEKLIERAKEKLSATNLSVSEIAYELGFEHPQSFSKLFKTKTNVSPLEFRASFN